MTPATPQLIQTPSGITIGEEAPASPSLPRTFLTLVMDFLQHYPGLAVTTGYLLLTAIGIIYEEFQVA